MAGADKTRSDPESLSEAVLLLQVFAVEQPELHPSFAQEKMCFLQRPPRVPAPSLLRTVSRHMGEGSSAEIHQVRPHGKVRSVPALVLGAADTAQRSSRDPPPGGAPSLPGRLCFFHKNMLVGNY